jgi:hypothetical protein
VETVGRTQSKCFQFVDAKTSKMEGPARRVRQKAFASLLHVGGHDKRAFPPHGVTCLSGLLGGTRLSRPLHNVGIAIAIRRTRQVGPSELVKCDV